MLILVSVYPQDLMHLFSDQNKYLTYFKRSAQMLISLSLNNLFPMNIKLQDSSFLFYDPSSFQNMLKVQALLKTHLFQPNSTNTQIKQLFDLFKLQSQDVEVLHQSTIPKQDPKALAQLATFLKSVPHLNPQLKNCLKNEKFMSLMLELRKHVKKGGGFEHVLYNGLFKGIVKGMIEGYRIPSFESLSVAEKTYFDYYKQLVYPLDVYQILGGIKPQIVEIGIADFYTTEEIQQKRVSSQTNQLFLKEVFCVQNLTKDCKIRNRVFSYENMSSVLMDETILVTALPTMSCNTSAQAVIVEMKGSECLIDQNGYTQSANKFHPKLPQKSFVCDLRPKSCSFSRAHRVQIEKIPVALTFKSPLNALHNPTKVDNYSPLTIYIAAQKSYRPLNSLGINKCCIVDLNHGDYDYVWTVVNISYYKQIRKIILKSSKTDIDKTTVIPDNKLLMMSGIPIKSIVQKRGSLVFINSGMLFWGEATGTSVHSTWEILPLNKHHFKNVIRYNQIDTNIKFPIKKVTIDVLNSLHYSDPQLTRYLLELAERWVKMEKHHKQTIVGNSMEVIQTKISTDIAVEKCGLCFEEIVSIKYKVKKLKSVWCNKCYLKYKSPAVIIDSSILMEGFLNRVKKTYKSKKHSTSSIIPISFLEDGSKKNQYLQPQDVLDSANLQAPKKANETKVINSTQTQNSKESKTLNKNNFMDTILEEGQILQSQSKSQYEKNPPQQKNPITQKNDEPKNVNTPMQNHSKNNQSIIVNKIVTQEVKTNKQIRYELSSSDEEDKNVRNKKSDYSNSKKADQITKTYVKDKPFNNNEKRMINNDEERNNLNQVPEDRYNQKRSNYHENRPYQNNSYQKSNYNNFNNKNSVDNQNYDNNRSNYSHNKNQNNDGNERINYYKNDRRNYSNQNNKKEDTRSTPVQKQNSKDTYNKDFQNSTNRSIDDNSRQQPTNYSQKKQQSEKVADYDNERKNTRDNSNYTQQNNKDNFSFKSNSQYKNRYDETKSKGNGTEQTSNNYNRNETQRQRDDYNGKHTDEITTRKETNNYQKNVTKNAEYDSNNTRNNNSNTNQKVYHNSNNYSNKSNHHNNNFNNNNNYNKNYRNDNYKNTSDARQQYENNRQTSRTYSPTQFVEEAEENKDRPRFSPISSKETSQQYPKSNTNFNKSLISIIKPNQSGQKNKEDNQQNNPRIQNTENRTQNKTYQNQTRNYGRNEDKNNERNTYNSNNNQNSRSREERNYDTSTFDRQDQPKGNSEQNRKPQSSSQQSQKTFKTPSRPSYTQNANSQPGTGKIIKVSTKSASNDIDF